MKLELKHIAPYLPYGLRIYQEDLREHVKPYSWELRIETGLKQLLEFQNKPLLRPLSQLTKEIEHNGEKFVPLEFITRMIEPEYIHIDKSTFDFNVINESIGHDQVFQLRYKTDYDNYKNLVMLNFHQQEKCFWHTERIIPISCIEKLLEWHFDIFGLIENNLAIELK